MFGILDRLYVRGKRGITYEGIDWKPQVIIRDNSNVSWYCFVPRLVMRNEKVRKGILPRNGKVVVYPISYVNLVVPDVEQTLENLRQVYFDALIKMDNDTRGGRNISVLGVSIGNVLSARLASDVPKRRVESLVSIVGGGRLGFSAWDSIATSQIAQNSGCSSVEEYESVLSEFAPVRSLEGLHAERVFARFGSSDLMIRYKPHGRKLRRALESLEAGDKDIKTYLWADHSSAIFRASREAIHR